MNPKKTINFMFCITVFLITLSQKAGAAVVKDFTNMNLMMESIDFEVKGKIKEALAKIEKLYAMNDQDYFVNLRLGWLNYLNKNPAKSEEYYLKASKISPESIEPFLAMSKNWAASNMYEKTKAATEAVLRLDSKNYSAWSMKIQAHLVSKQYKSALDGLASALKSYPTDPIFLEQKGVALEKLGKMDEAKATLSQLLMIQPSNAYARKLVDSTN